MSANRHTVEGSCRSAASPEAAWSVWTDPSIWRGGPIESAELHGEFEVGGRITTKVKGYRPATYTISLIEPPRLWINDAEIPGLKMSVEHIIEPVATGIVLTERMLFSGPLGGVVARLIRRRLEATFAATTAHCARLAEARGA